jgi:hypothetical protein
VSDPLDDLLEALVEEQKRHDEADESAADGASLRTRLEAAQEAESEVGLGLTPLEQRAEMKRRVRDLRQLLAVFLKAGKTLRLYSESHRFFDRFAEEFLQRLGEQFELVDSLTFEVTPVSINWDGNVIYENREQRENLAFKLYRDGVRLLQFRRGVTVDEVREFVTLIAREVDTGTGSKDLSVLFWEADFKHVHIAVAETFVEYSAEAARVLSEIAQDITELQRDFEIESTLTDRPKHEPEAYKDRAGRTVEDEIERLLHGDDPWATEDSAVVEETEMPELPAAVNDEHKMRRIYEDLLGLEDPYATFEEVGSVLAEVIAAENDPDELRSLLARVDDALSPLLATAAIGPLNSVLRRLALLGRQGYDREHFSGEAIRDFFVNFCQSDRLSLLARAIDDDWAESWKGDLFTFVSMQSRGGVSELFGFLGQVRNLEPRRVITDALILLADRRANPFQQALRSRNWHLVADSVYALGRIGDPRSLDTIISTFEREEYQVRLEVLQALRPHQSPRIQELMFTALGDPKDKVRMAALRYLAVYKIKDSIPFLTETMGSRGFDDREFDEKRGWYITLGHVAGQSSFMAFRRRAEAARGRDKVTEEVHLALLGIRAIRSAESGRFMQEFVGMVRGDLQLLVRKLIHEKKGS